MKKVHLITSTYNDIERFRWRNLIDFSETELFLYRKCDDLEIGQSRIDGEFIDIPNYGSCEYSFFYHIVNNYDNLGEYNIFTKMNLYEDFFRNFSEVFANAKYYDFYQGGGAPISQIWYNENTMHLLDLPTKYQKLPMNINMVKKNRPKHITGVWSPDGPGWTGQEYEYAGNADNQIDWFNYLYGNENIPGEVYSYQWGPCFSISRELIQRHPKSVYQHFLNIFYPFNSWNYEVAKKYYQEDPAKQKFEDEIKFQTWTIGRHYHDELLRFFRLFFTFGLDHDKYKINEI